ncbi:hypothetical protein D3C76_1529330 [compost metagenome]
MQPIIALGAGILSEVHQELTAGAQLQRQVAGLAVAELTALDGHQAMPGGLDHLRRQVGGRGVDEHHLPRRLFQGGEGRQQGLEVLLGIEGQHDDAAAHSQIGFLVRAGDGHRFKMHSCLPTHQRWS